MSNFSVEETLEAAQLVVNNYSSLIGASSFEDEPEIHYDHKSVACLDYGLGTAQEELAALRKKAASADSMLEALEKIAVIVTKRTNPDYHYMAMAFHDIFHAAATAIVMGQGDTKNDTSDKESGTAQEVK